MSKLYLAANGKPFSDPSAADAKALLLGTEIGKQFEVVSVEGGYAVRLISSVMTNNFHPIILRPSYRGQIGSLFKLLLFGYLAAFLSEINLHEYVNSGPLDMYVSLAQAYVVPLLFYA